MLGIDSLINKTPIPINLNINHEKILKVKITLFLPSV